MASIMESKTQLNWQYFYGKPTSFGEYKVSCEDFIVIEDLGFELSGEGEHVFLQIEKTNCNTLFVADKLANWANISPKLISYAGLKDKHAITTQWFSLHLPGKIELDLESFKQDGIRILKAIRHNKKLKIGALKANSFELILRQITDMNSVIERLQLIQQKGVPNYFGEQRFGFKEQNIHQALRWAKGEIQVKDRKKRSFYLSALRSSLFNHIVSARIENGLFEQPLLGDIVQLSGSKSWFIVEESEQKSIKNRLIQHDLFLTAPMLGDNGVLTRLDAFDFEQNIALQVFDEACLNLFKKERIETSRRAILTLPEHLNWDQLDPETLKLTFTLPAGNYATSLVREVIQNNNREP